MSGKEADIYLGIVAARTPGWVREEFLPFIDKLEQQGFYVTPNRLFQSLTAVGAKSVRFKQVTDDFWNKNNIAPAWSRTQSSWHHALKCLESYGIVTNEHSAVGCHIRSGGRSVRAVSCGEPEQGL